MLEKQRHKTRREIRVCRNCGNKWETTSPPTRDEYEHARLYVEHLEVLLPPEVVAHHHRAGFSDSHALFIDDTDFCNIMCLLDYITQYMLGARKE